MKTIISLLKQGAKFSFSAALLWLVNNMFDWMLYPAVVYLAGNLLGAIIMTVLSVPFNYGLILAYDKIGQDLFALEKAKRVGNRISSHSRWVGFLSLSLWDPIPAVIFARSEVNAFKGLDRTGWMYFIIATLIANSVWIGVTILGLEAASFVVNL